MNPSLIHDSQRLNDILFGLVLAAAAASAGLLATSAPREAGAMHPSVGLTHVQLERVVVSGKRPAAPLARAGAPDPNS